MTNEITPPSAGAPVSVSAGRPMESAPPFQPERPALPQRQTAGVTKAQPDDLADVKKVKPPRHDLRLNFADIGVFISALTI
jgi:hypothetical protein